MKARGVGGNKRRRSRGTGKPQPLRRASLERI
jgi:hypothetical protein